MQKRGMILGALVLAVLMASFASALNCAPSILMINQDPYPAIPGDYVKLVFQVNGINNPDCGDVSISLIDNFPFSIDPGVAHTYSASSFFEKDYGSFMVVPYKVRINEEALDGENTIEVSLNYGLPTSRTSLIKDFNVSVEDARSSFEVFVKNYDFSTNTLTFEILNSGKNDVKAVTIKVLDGVRTKLKGADTNIIGDLDSNEYTTVDFLVAPLTTKIPISITYTDSIDVRRTVEQSVEFNPANFEGVGAKKGTSGWMIAFIVVVVLVVGWFVWKRFKKKKSN